MISGFGNLFGYLGSGAWRRACTVAGQTDWPTFWMGTSAAAAVVFLWFAFSYRGRGPQH
jgi:sugar phosphate permease